MNRHRLILSAAAAVLVTAAGCGNGTPTSPTATATITTTAAVVTVAPPTSCSAWAGTQRASGVTPATGSVASQREALYAAGGGVRAVSNRYFAAWFPSGWSSSSPRRVLVGLHGTGGAPETEWSVDWKDIASSRGWAYVGLKYVDDATGSHDGDTVIYANLKSTIDALTASCDFGSPSMFLVGFSRGSAQSFPVAYLDLKDRRLFKAIGNNSGAWPAGQPMVATMAGFVARGETTAYSGAKFWMYCGALDMEHGSPMCDEMRNARTFVLSYGGTVERLYEDPTGAHGGLAKNADAWGAMFTYFEGLR
ncbi:MAG: hypothetical protein WC815_22780 [Vicinamibacterales bacterium]|jgi:hypothetical protein